MDEELAAHLDTVRRDMNDGQERLPDSRAMPAVR
jgi:hypothetical protein